MEPSTPLSKRTKTSGPGQSETRLPPSSSSSVLSSSLPDDLLRSIFFYLSVCNLSVISQLSVALHQRVFSLIHQFGSKLDKIGLGIIKQPEWFRKRTERWPPSPVDNMLKKLKTDNESILVASVSFDGKEMVVDCKTPWESGSYSSARIPCWATHSLIFNFEDEFSYDCRKTRRELTTRVFLWFETQRKEKRIKIGDCQIEPDNMTINVLRFNYASSSGNHRAVLPTSPRKRESDRDLFMLEIGIIIVMPPPLSWQFTVFTDNVFPLTEILNPSLRSEMSEEGWLEKHHFTIVEHRL
jgi:hypothetical protein